MKVKVKDLLPNPFRDIKHYPISSEKVESLAKSITQTGFWDNILARKKNGKIEIAYGHHRLVVLQRDCAPDFVVDIPVKDLDDATMIRIMANENDESWTMGPGIIDETVRVTYEYLSSSFAKRRDTGRGQKEVFEGLPEPEVDEVKWSAIAWQMACWLGGNWNEQRIWHSLDRLDLIEEDILDKESVESMPTEQAARDLTAAVKEVKPSKETQKKVAKKIVKSRMKKDTEEGAIHGKHRIVTELYEEEHGDEEKTKEEKRKLEEKVRRSQFEYHLSTLAGKARGLWQSLVDLLEFRDVLHSDHYQKAKEAQDFVYWMAETFSVFRLLMAEDKQGKKIQKNIEATIEMCTEAESRADEEKRSKKATESLKVLLASNKKEAK